MTSRDEGRTSTPPQSLGRALLLAGLGAADSLRSVGDGVLSRLIAMGRDRERRGRARMERRRYEATRGLTQATRSLLRVADVAAAGLLSALKIPTRQDLRALENHIDRIADRLQEIGAEGEE